MMEFLKTAALPQPAEHVQLLLLMMNVALVALIPYLGFMLGTALLSAICGRRGRSTGDEPLATFAGVVGSIAAPSKSIVAFLAIIPSLSVVFFLAELLQGTPSIAPGLMGFGCLFLIGGSTLYLVSAFLHRQSRLLRGYQESLERGQGPGGSHSLGEELASAEQGEERARIYGILCLAIASVLVVGAIAVAGDPDSWPRISDVFDLILFGSFGVRYLEFLGIAGAITGIGVVYLVPRKEREPDEPEIGELARRVGTRISTWALVLLPVVMLGSVAVLPAAALSGSVFGTTGLGLILFFAAAHFLYALKRESRPVYATYAFCALAFGMVAVVSRDQLAIRSATGEHAAQLGSAAERDVDELKARLGVVVVKAMTGQEIYDAKCSACHLFDTKKIGPAYKDVVPKYFGRKAQMIAFVMNPVKVDPAFPSMPNQGLRPAEADSIVSFLLAKFGPNPQTAQTPGK